VIPSQLGRVDDEGNYLLKSDEITHISKKYIELYKNRLDK